ncbi:hypothetical protein DESUT3_34760 [Desulfuromonas versatilis]|uniref:MSHA biogenesis protein MshJ n=1 Tax=Desulfuromonas versatilis TaxID=2802975 RepID=A0ABM8I0F3_9BACT|nr:type II secretion system protein GspM [Desulfuromonas versatilis]BCR06407.1 hypothetical protein DESUT3_34760 [Desulfuromonas versatilis]
MNPLLGRLKTWGERLEKRSLRERALLLLGALALLAAAWHALLYQPIEERRRLLQARIQAIDVQTAQITAQGEQVIALHSQDPDQKNRLALQQLEAEIAAIGAELEGMADNLVSPREMPRLVEQVLSRQKGLRLLRMENLEPVALLEAPAGAALPGEMPNLYRHALRIEFEGSYVDTLAYLRELETLPRHLFWDELQIEVLRHPTSRVRLTVHTLSLKRGWIGV